MAARKKAAVTTTDEIAKEEVSIGTGATVNDTVIVCLNRAMGIDYTLSDGREIVIEGHNATLRGYNTPGNLNIGGGFSLKTVARADWEEIKAKYGNTALFKSGRIYASDSREDALAEAREKKDTRHGLEPTKGVQSEKVEKA